MDYKKEVTFKATELTADITQIESWFWDYAVIGKNYLGHWILSVTGTGEMEFNFGEYAVLENEKLVLYPADTFNKEFTAVEVENGEQ